MFENFDNKYNSVTKIFEALIKNNTYGIPNSIILHGPDVIAQYFFAMLLARGANCQGDKTQECNCQNCRWIKANEHPEIMTVSKINSKPEKDTSKTVISKLQTDFIKDKLVVSSDYHRFFIFCDAEERDFFPLERDNFNKFSFLNQKFPNKESALWVPTGLNQKCFPDVSENSLLKSIEEPPSDVTFIFLTENAENILSTIVSRSQIFYIPGNSKQVYNYDFLIEPLKNYPNIDRKKAILISNFLTDYSKNNEKNLSEIICSIQTYLKELAKKNPKNLNLKKKIFEDTEKLQNADLMIKSSVKDQSVADEIGYILTN